MGNYTKERVQLRLSVTCKDIHYHTNSPNFLLDQLSELESGHEVKKEKAVAVISNFLVYGIKTYSNHGIADVTVCLPIVRKGINNGILHMLNSPDCNNSTRSAAMNIAATTIILGWPTVSTDMTKSIASLFKKDKYSQKGVESAKNIFDFVLSCERTDAAHKALFTARLKSELLDNPSDSSMASMLKKYIPNPKLKTLLRDSGGN